MKALRPKEINAATAACLTFRRCEIDYTYSLVTLDSVYRYYRYKALEQRCKLAAGLVTMWSPTLIFQASSRRALILDGDAGRNVCDRKRSAEEI